MNSKMWDKLAKQSDALWSAVQEIVVAHPEFEAGMRHILKWARASIAGASVCFLMSGESGTGKTTLLDRLKKQFPSKRTEEGTTMILVAAGVPARPTPLGLVEVLMKAMHMKNPDKGSLQTRTNRLIDQIRAMGVRIIALDDFHHCIDPALQVALYDVSEWLKALVGETKVSIFGFGLPHSKMVILANEQLKRRYCRERSLHRFDWLKQSSQDEFCGVLSNFQVMLEDFKLPDFRDPDNALRLYLACGGLIGLLAAILREATWDALIDERRTIRMSHLATAWTSAVWESDNFGLNPLDLRTKLSNLPELIARAKRLNVHQPRPVAARKKKSPARAKQELAAVGL